jgi:hypothetical protein
MGLFDFFKRKKSTDNEVQSTSEPTENNTETESNLLLAMPIFKNNERYDIHKVVEHLQSYWGLKVSGMNDDCEDTAVFDVDDQSVAVALMPGSIPLDELEDSAKYAYFWQNALEEVKDHTAHAIVTVLSNDKPAFERYTLFSKLISSILLTSNAIAIYQGSQTLLMPREIYLNGLDDLKNGDAPIPIWVYLGLVNSDEGLSIYTYGMKGFGKPEMEVINSQLDFEELFDFMINTASYVITQDVTLKAGETVGSSADERVNITSSKGVYLDGETLKFEV